MDTNRNKNSKMCTDIFWLGLFLAFLALLILIGMISTDYNGYRIIVKGHDSFGNICGTVKNKHFENFPESGLNLSSKPYLYYMNIVNIPLVFKICTEHCFSDPLYVHQIAIDFWREFENYRCIYTLNRRKPVPSDSRYCPNVNVFNSTIYRHRCIPMTEEEYEYSKDIYRAVSADKQIGEMFFVAIYLSWRYVLVLSGIGLFISVALWPIIYFFPHSNCWFICTLVIFATTGLCILLFFEYNKIPPEYNVANSTDVKTMQYKFLEDAILNRRILCVLAVTVSVLLIILVFSLSFMRKYFTKITLLLVEVQIYWKKLKKLMIIPFIAILVISIILPIWSYVMLCLSTATIRKVISTKSNEMIDNKFKSFDRVEYVEDNNIRILTWIYIIGFLWITEFIIAFEQYIVGVSIFRFYFQLPEKSSGIYVFLQLLKHHLGTIAKGSFVCTFWKIPKQVLLNGGKIIKYINPKTSILHKLEETIGFLQPIAYTMVAEEHIDLCSAGRKTWKIVQKKPNLLRSINEMAMFILFLLKLFVAFVICIVGICILNNVNDVHLYFAPMILCAIFGYCIANIICSCLEMTLDTICLCVCEDNQINTYIGRGTKSNLASLLHQSRTDIKQSVVTIVKT